MDQIKEAFSKEKRNSEVMQAFGFRMRNQFTQNKAYRRSKEMEWLESLRQYKGLYDPDVVIEKNASKVYPKITRSKINIVLSRLHEMLFPETEKNFEIGPTPEPSMPREIVLQIAMALVQEDPETGEPIIPSKEDLQIAIKLYAKDACERMSSVIDDQLTEMDYPEETKKVLRSGLMYGTGLMKGPMIATRTKRRWQPTTDGKDYEEKVEKEEVPDLQFTRLWDWYPDMTVTELEMIEGSFERHVMTKHDVRQLMKRSDFHDDIIELFLKEHPDGNYTPLNWEVDLQVIEIEAGTGKASGSVSTTTTGSTEDATRSTTRQLGKKYEVLEYWGYIDGADLSACGLEIDDVTAEYAANVWFLGDRPIKATLYEGALDQYKAFYYEKDETSIFGEGLGRIMRHSQLAIAAAARMLLDNAACCAGPQIEVNWSLMTPGTDLSSVYSRKIWFREGKGVDAQYPAIRVYNFDSHTEELLKIVDAFKQFGDEETTLPTWMIGQMANNETAQATSGRMSLITVSIKDVVKNFDSFTEKIIRDVYAWNMDFNPRSDIKGDFAVKARGVSSLVMKEVRMQALAQLKTTLAPEDWDYIPRREYLKETMKAHDINIELLSEQEVAKIRKQRDEGVMNKLQIEMIESEIAKNKAQSLSLLTKSKKANVEAQKEAQTPPEIPEGSDPRLTEEEIALQQTERAGKEADIRRKDEAHAQKMEHEGEKHRLKVATDSTKVAHEVTVKDKKAEHDMKMKEESTKAANAAKKEAAKHKPAAKPAKPAK